MKKCCILALQSFSRPQINGEKVSIPEQGEFRVYIDRCISVMVESWTRTNASRNYIGCYHMRLGYGRNQTGTSEVTSVGV